MKTRSMDPEVTDSAGGLLLNSIKILAEDQAFNVSDLYQDLTEVLLVCLQASMKNNCSCIKKQAELNAIVGRRTPELSQMCIKAVEGFALFLMAQLQNVDVSTVDVDLLANYATLLHSSCDINLAQVIQGSYFSQSMQLFMTAMRSITQLDLTKSTIKLYS